MLSNFQGLVNDCWGPSPWTNAAATVSLIRLWLRGVRHMRQGVGRMGRLAVAGDAHLGAVGLDRAAAAQGGEGFAAVLAEGDQQVVEGDPVPAGEDGP